MPADHFAHSLEHPIIDLIPVNEREENGDMRGNSLGGCLVEPLAPLADEGLRLLHRCQKHRTSVVILERHAAEMIGHPTSPSDARRITRVPLRSAIARAGAAGIALALLLLAGCGGDGNAVAPAACLETSQGYLRALQRAPGEVRLGGTTSISDCLVPEQDAGQLASVGREMIVAATKLNGEARRDPSGAVAVQLGYLLGAVSEGADAIHTDLVRRLNSAARFSETGGTLGASFERAFGRGYAAGRRSG